ncbi:tautomerase family protein [Paenibacillus illinoisensis]|uniref:Tautomerase enzyme n=1 Tax=Paenibacillus illinoisensis TaxID=59845 RepID=A0A2W0CYS6_9BACL|nr:tautomerase family protein [Paenibacillus illinoisensis]PYY28811.1 Tautomerase enzyme [Paenibacillus illinoisensis]
MAQIKVFGVREQLNPMKEQLASVIHSVLMDVLGLPENKKFQRYFPMNMEDFQYPPDRSAAYTIVEISMFEGRSMETKKDLIQQLYKQIHEKLLLPVHDLEITIFETPRAHWGIRGLPGDELELNYNVEV